MNVVYCQLCSRLSGVTLSIINAYERKQMWRAPLTSRATPTARPRAQHVHSCRCTTREVEIKSRSVLRVEAGFKYFPRTPVDRPAPHAAQLGGGSRSTWRSARRWLALDGAQLDMALSSAVARARQALRAVALLAPPAICRGLRGTVEGCVPSSPAAGRARAPYCRGNRPT